MFRACRRRVRSLRLFALVLLLLVMAVQPVFAALGELDELGHGSHGVSEQSDASHRNNSADADIRQPGQLWSAAADEVKATGDDSQSTWHAIAHYAHCCGSVPVSLPSGLAASQPPRIGASLLQRVTVLPLHARISELDRPPISI